MNTRNKHLDASEQSVDAAGLAAAPAKQRNTIVAQPDLGAEIDAELQRDLSAKTARRSALDLAVLRTRRVSIRSQLTAAGSSLEADAPRHLPVYVDLYDQGFDALEAAIKLQDTAIPGQRRYSQATKELTRSLFEVVNGFRKRAGDRLGHSDAAADVLHLCGVGEVVAADAPQDVLSLATRQLAATGNPAHASLLTASGLFPERQHARLQPMVDQLQSSIHAGVGTELSRGEATAQVEICLLRLEITLSRAAAFIEEFGSAQAAEALEKEIPRRHHKKADKSGGSGDGNGDKGSTQAQDKAGSGKASDTSSGDVKPPAPPEGNDPTKA